MGIKGNEEATKDAIDMPGETKTRLPYTDYKLDNQESNKFQMANSSRKLHIKPSIEEWESAHNSCWQYKTKLSRVHIGHIRLTNGCLMTRNDQQPTFLNASCRNQTLTITHCFMECPLDLL